MRTVLFIEKPIGIQIYSSLLKQNFLEFVAVVTNESKDNWWKNNEIWEDLYTSKNLILCGSEKRLSTNQIESILNLDYELVLSIQYRWKIQYSIVKKATHSANLHLSPLPLYRGHNPFFHAILDSQTTFGVTLHEISNEFDSGAIIKKKLFPVDPLETAYSLYNKSYFAAEEVVFDYLNVLKQGKKIKTYPQPSGYKFYTKQDFYNRILELESSGTNKELLNRALYFPPITQYLNNN
jgi:methionyl-tRNA formyltransferase